jgi:outer membrane immunogenic protein
MLRNCLLGFVIAVWVAFGATGASAQERCGPKGDPCYAPSWDGFYLGLNAGYAFDDRSGEITFDNSIGQTYTGNKTFDADGGFWGGQAGYNFLVAPNWVVGIETDMQTGPMDDKISGMTVTAFGDIYDGSRHIKWFGTTRGRIGYSFGRTLVYATGGIAYGKIAEKLSRVNSGPAVVSNSSVRTGFAVGGGIEHYFLPGWSAKLEYQYIDLGDERLTGEYPGVGITLRTNELSNDFHTVRAGVSYHFGP